MASELPALSILFTSLQGRVSGVNDSGGSWVWGGVIGPLQELVWAEGSQFLSPPNLLSPELIFSC